MHQDSAHCHPRAAVWCLCAELTVVTQTGDGAPGIVINIEKTNGGVAESTGRGFGPEPIRVAETYAHPLDQRFDIGDQVRNSRPRERSAG